MRLLSPFRFLRVCTLILDSAFRQSTPLRRHMMQDHHTPMPKGGKRGTKKGTKRGRQRADETPDASVSKDTSNAEDSQKITK